MLAATPPSPDLVTTSERPPHIGHHIPTILDPCLARPCPCCVSALASRCRQAGRLQWRMMIISPAATATIILLLPPPPLRPPGILLGGGRGSHQGSLWEGKGKTTTSAAPHRKGEDEATQRRWDGIKDLLDSGGLNGNGKWP